MSTSVSRAALALFMRGGYVPGPCTIYGEVRKLRPGHLLRVDLVARRAEERSWWHSRDALRRGRADRFAGSDDEAICAVDEAILESVRLRMVSDVPVGAFLSGGIDSSAVVAAMQEVSPRPVKTFTIGFDSADLDESGFARAVAEHLGTEHTDLRLTGREVVDAVPEAAAAFDEPFADSSLVPTWLVARLARERVTVALSGDGGDELFGGYYRYGWVERVARANGRIPAPLRGALGAFLGVLPPGPLNAAGRLASRLAPPLAPFDRAGDRLRKLAPLVGRTDPWQLYLDLTAIDRDSERLVLGGSLPTTALTDPSELCPEADLVERMMQADIASYLVDDILVKVDRTTMSRGLEAREPLLDHTLAELALRLPPRMRIRDGERKWILRRVAERRIPRALLERPKRGFSMPLVGWLRGPLRPWAEALLDPARLSQEGFLDPAEVRRRWDALAHASDSDPVAPIWNVLMFQAWLERSRRGS
jgi:asparagine synthase (glutamine-hydrolysing)